MLDADVGVGKHEGEKIQIVAQKLEDGVVLVVGDYSQFDVERLLRGRLLRFDEPVQMFHRDVSILLIAVYSSVSVTKNHSIPAVYHKSITKS